MFDGGFAVISGLAGGAAMVAALYMGMAMMPGQMKMNLLRMLGTMMLSDGTMAYMAGGMIHAMMSVIFGLLHVAIYAALDLESNLAAWGLLFGAVHWMVVGMGLGMIPMMHAGIRKGIIGEPGVFATRYPPRTAVGFLMLHLMFGVLVGVIYSALSARVRISMIVWAFDRRRPTPRSTRSEQKIDSFVKTPRQAGARQG